jgi:hypothetical protein
VKSSQLPPVFRGGLLPRRRASIGTPESDEEQPRRRQGWTCESRASNSKIGMDVDASSNESSGTPSGCTSVTSVRSASTPDLFAGAGQRSGSKKSVHFVDDSTNRMDLDLATLRGKLQHRPRSRRLSLQATCKGGVRAQVDSLCLLMAVDKLGDLDWSSDKPPTRISHLPKFFL